ncbi:MAG: trimeric intracellular cation channel family protein [Nitrosopumilus sp.]|nr:trimeric intracellular cation channel family protein [Nitrosopumilus sp.]
MSDPYSTISVFPLIIQLLDFFGTMAFAASGSFKAIEKKSDIVGVIILSIITGLAGGIIRDVIFGRSPPIGIVNPVYLLISISTGVAVFLLYPRLKKHWNLFLKFDAIGLGVFTIIGATTAYTLFGLNFLIIAFAGVLTAIGGGILRDVFVNEIPIVFVKELYVTASFTGIIIFYLLLILLDPIIAAIIGAISSTSVRLLAIKYGWNLPRPRN